MRRLRREAVIRRAQNGFVLKVDIEVVRIYPTAEGLLEDLEKALNAEPDQVPVAYEMAPFKEGL